MRVSNRCSVLFISFFVCISSYAQETVHSILKSQSKEPQWQIDSARIVNKYANEGNKPTWQVDSAKTMPLPAPRILDADDYTPYISSLDDKLSIDLGGMVTITNGDYAPFWMTNNQHGIGSIKENKEYLRLKSFGNKKISIPDHTPLNLSGVVDILASNNLESDFYIQQLYAELAYKAVTFSVGMKERNSLFKNTELSSGGLTLSNNARPIPQVEIAMPKFVSIFNTDGKLEIMGGLSYGWFTDTNFKHHNAADGNYADNVLYHRKYGFMKFRPNKTWSFIGGLEMDTQWGGRFYRKGEYWGESRATLKEFFKVLVPMSGGSDSDNITDKVNITGNVYGSIHLIGNYENKDIKVKAYHEHFFEDHSGLIFKNIPDGLYGIEVHLNKVSWLSDILFEYLHTKDQSGPFLWDKNEEIPIQVSGGDNYYNQVDYISLTNFGYVIGNPLFVSPIYNDGSSLTVYNTRLSSFHFGVAGDISKYLRYRTLVTYSRSWGTPLIPAISIRDQFSSMLELSYRNNTRKLKGYLFSGAIAYDHSQMIGDNFGLQLKLSKTFQIR